MQILDKMLFLGHSHQGLAPRHPQEPDRVPLAPQWPTERKDVNQHHSESLPSICRGLPMLASSKFAIKLDKDLPS